MGDGIGILDLLMMAKLIPSKGEGRRLISQGGIYVNGERIDDQNRVITCDDFKEEQLFVRKGKKTYHRIILSR